MSAKQREATGMGVANPGPNLEEYAGGEGGAGAGGVTVAVDAGREEIPPLYESLPVGERRA
jgi:hypothetical protein